jgi:hypothetical protein
MAKKCMAYNVSTGKKEAVPCKSERKQMTASDAARALGGMSGKTAETIRKRTAKPVNYMP